MGEPRQRPLKSLAIAQAVSLCIGTLAFYLLLCILLSYSVLDLISPHPQVNGLHGNWGKDSSGSADSDGRTGAESPISNGPFISHFNSHDASIPDSRQPWDPRTPSGARILTLLSAQRFPSPSPSSNSTTGRPGMHPPPPPQWPPAKFISSKPKNLQAPVPLEQLSGVAHLQTAPGQWNPNSQDFQMSPLPSIQSRTFLDSNSWDTTELQSKNLERRDWIIRAFSHTWEGYKKTAWGFDQTRPLSGRGQTAFAGWGATIIDNLDTLLMMNMTQEYNYARTHVRVLDWSNPGSAQPIYNSSTGEIKNSYANINLLESGARYLGALLSAYDLSGDKLMLSKADELAQWLLPAFNTKTGVPVPNYDLGTNPSGGASGETYLSEAGSLLLEFTRLAQITGKAHYFNAVDRAAQYLQGQSWNSTSRLGNLFPQKIKPDEPTQMTGVYNLNARSSGYYENLVKEAILLRGNSKGYQQAYTSSVDSIFQYLAEDIQVDNQGTQLSIIGEAYSLPGKVGYLPKISQQSCSAAAMIGLGARLLQQDLPLNFAQNQTDACLWVHETSPGGIGPDEITIINYEGSARQVSSTPMNEISNPSHLNRPNTIESIFYMWRLTGNREWQERGWKLFTRWAEASITEVGFAEIEDVTDDINDDSNKFDGYTGTLSTESMKYFYLLFSDPETISLDEYVFNVASHPFKIPGSKNSQVVNWQDPQDSQVAYLNPPIANVMASKYKGQQNTTGIDPQGSGTHIQQWSRTVSQDPKTPVSEAVTRSGSSS
ncbi:hypothetical protein, variant [Puccinia triticina 1-1 BBBD Race 1]|uniref:alpha-1,2-Mannosidase n=2 Tax=Puccinia triticina TaxID=208348 RepID=A0A0C4EJC1_PUCT1|nr:uncharacterized protein PtA15_3A592 [Puccinia triticina]OAV93522.1 hypothetical protein PTTG_00839 [Puccinia triticina 1-1 BBBD Race 1]OAV93523.1 hypothetical protein, variant [Puccinia triticina 1-1 BBBD Race 1]WAQ83223.1 hypothetical protein PtA15_3A592 [Puccinia triticina]WAR54072.1 hypothetical protein PtB15_3B582 [Puccinia triticina]